MAAIACGEKMSTSGLRTHASTILSLVPSGASHGALWLVETITSRPARLHAANASVKAAASASPPPLVRSMSKVTPSNPG